MGTVVYVGPSKTCCTIDLNNQTQRVHCNENIPHWFHAKCCFPFQHLNWRSFKVLYQFMCIEPQYPFCHFVWGPYVLICAAYVFGNTWKGWIATQKKLKFLHGASMFSITDLVTAEHPLCTIQPVLRPLLHILGSAFTSCTSWAQLHQLPATCARATLCMGCCCHFPVLSHSPPSASCLL
jgi:hypothetical protein